MIDIHCHVLPGMDDGPSSMDESLAMVRLAVADGIRGAICTPHWHPLFWPNERNAIAIAVDTLRLRLQAEDIAFDVWPGSELSLDADLEAGLAGGRLATLNGGSWVLLELPGPFPPSGIDNFLLNFHRSGRRLVLAHPNVILLSCAILRGCMPGSRWAWPCRSRRPACSADWGLKSQHCAAFCWSTGWFISWPAMAMVSKIVVPCCGRLAGLRAKLRGSMMPCD